MKFIKYATDLGLTVNFSPMILDIRNVDRKKLYEQLKMSDISIPKDVEKSDPDYIIVDHGKLYGAKDVKDFDRQFQNYFIVILKEELGIYCLFR